MSTTDRVLHLFAATAAGLVSVAAAVGLVLPKGVAVAAGVVSYVAAAAANSIMPKKKAK